MYSTLSLTFDSMFIPMASPVSALNLTNTSRPATAVWVETSRAYPLVELNTFCSSSKFDWLFNHNFRALLETRE